MTPISLRLHGPCLVLPLLLACSVTLAQPSQTAGARAPAARPGAASDPLDAAAPVPALRFESTLSRQPAPQPLPALPWRDANDAVLRIGGWRAYLREAAEARAAEAAATASPAMPAVQPPAPAAGPASAPAARPPAHRHH